MDKLLKKSELIYSKYLGDEYVYYCICNHLIIVESDTFKIKIIFDKFNPEKNITCIGDNNNQPIKINDIINDETKCYLIFSEAFYSEVNHNLLKILWYANGRIKHMQILTGHNNVLHTYWYENGIKEKEFLYVNNKLNGLVKHWYSNGNLEKEINYVDDHPNGLLKIYASNGNVSIEKMLDYDNIFGINYYI